MGLFAMLLYNDNGRRQWNGDLTARCYLRARGQRDAGRVDVVLEAGDAISSGGDLVNVLLVDEVKKRWTGSQSRSQADMHSKSAGAG